MLQIFYDVRTNAKKTRPPGDSCTAHSRALAFHLRRRWNGARLHAAESATAVECPVPAEIPAEMPETAGNLLVFSVSAAVQSVQFCSAPPGAKVYNWGLVEMVGLSEHESSQIDVRGTSLCIHSNFEFSACP